ncbi:MAG: hypothetical protein ACRC2Y_05025 [Aeromonas veronii]
MMRRFLDVFRKYQGKPHGHGSYDCNLMVLEATGYPIETIPPYSTAMEGFKSLRSFGFRRMADYLISRGYSKSEPKFISDFDVVVIGASCGIWFDGSIFSTLPDQTFGFSRVDKSFFNNKKIEVFKWA